MKIIKIIIQTECERCHGLKKLDDAEPYDMGYFTEWDCPECAGIGYKTMTIGDDDADTRT